MILKLKRSSIVALILFLLVVLLHAYFRLAHLESIQFDYDQEMIAKKAWEIGKEHDLTLLGTRVGHYPIYVGPLYFYLATCFFHFFNYHPIANTYHAYLWSFLALITLFYTVRTIFNRRMAFLASMIYAVSPLLIRLDRIAWNNNPLMFVATLALLSIYQIATHTKPSSIWFLALGIAIGLGLNSHFNVIFLLLTALIVITARHRWSVKNGFLLIATIVLFISPLILFDFRHGFTNTKGLFALVSNSPVSEIQKQPPSFAVRLIKQVQVTTENPGKILLAKNQQWVFTTAGFLIIWLFFLSRQPKLLKFIFGISVILPIILFTFYTGEVPEYYFLVTYPVWIMVITSLISPLLSSPKLVVPILVSFLLLLTFDQNLIKTNNGQTLFYKLSLINHIKSREGSNPVKIHYKMHAGWSFGYSYLYRLVDLNVTDESDRVYTIVYQPADPKITLDQQFGELGLIYPGTIY